MPSAACASARLRSLFVLPIAVLATVVRTTNSSGRGASESAGDKRSASRAIVAFSAFTAVFTIGVTPYISLLPEIAKNAFGQNAAGYGAMAAAGGIGAIGGAIWLAWRGEVAKTGRTAIAAAFAGALLLVAFAHAHALVTAYVLLVLMGTVDTLVYALANTYVQQIAGDDARGRANAIFSLAFLGGIPLGNAILGVAAGRFGSQAVLGWSGALVAAFAAIFWFAAPRVRDAA